MTDLVSLQEQNTQLREQVKAVSLGQENAWLEAMLGMTTLVESAAITRPGDRLLTPQEIQREVGWGGAYAAPFISQAEDYYEGRCKPFYENEQDVCQQRGIGRYMAGADSMAVCVLSNLRNYTIGPGFKVTVSAKKGKGGEAYVAEIQDFVDEFRELNKLEDGGEKRFYISSVVDGDHLLWLRPNGPNAPRVRYVGGEHIGKPQDVREVEDYHGLEGLCWEFGVATDICDYENVHGYFVDWYGKASRAGGWDFIRESESVFVKRNVPHVCKRGISDYYIPFWELERAANLSTNVGKQAIIQAAIAGIKKAAPQATQTSLDGALRAKLTGQKDVAGPDGFGRTINVEQHLGGKFLNTTADYMYGPVGTPQGEVFVAIYQHVARRAGTRWHFTENMISGDASNNAYASLLAAEAPVVQFFRAEQGNIGATEVELIWKAIDMAAAHGRFGGIGSAQLKRVLTIKAEGHDPASRDPQKMEQVYDAQQAAGILSAKTRAAKSNLDYEEEVANGAKEKTPPGFDPVTGAPLLDPNKQQPQLPPNPVMEQRIEALASRALESLKEAAQ